MPATTLAPAVQQAVFFVPEELSQERDVMWSIGRMMQNVCII